MNAHGHGFWWLVTWACVAWYSSITVYVAWRGIGDIRSMLRNIRSNREEPPS